MVPANCHAYCNMISITFILYMHYNRCIQYILVRFLNLPDKRYLSSNTLVQTQIVSEKTIDCTLNDYLESEYFLC